MGRNSQLTGRVLSEMRAHWRSVCVTCASLSVGALLFASDAQLLSGRDVPDPHGYVDATSPRVVGFARALLDVSLGRPTIRTYGIAPLGGTRRVHGHLVAYDPVGGCSFSGEERLEAEAYNRAVAELLDWLPATH